LAGYHKNGSREGHQEKRRPPGPRLRKKREKEEAPPPVKGASAVAGRRKGGKGSFGRGGGKKKRLHQLREPSKVAPFFKGKGKGPFRKPPLRSGGKTGLLILQKGGKGGTVNLAPCQKKFTMKKKKSPASALEGGGLPLKKRTVLPSRSSRGGKKGKFPLNFKEKKKGEEGAHSSK